MKKVLLISLPILVIILAATGYFYGAPALQTNGYKTVARTNQLALASSTNKAIGAASQNAFLAQGISIPETKNALKISKDAIADLETKIHSNEKSLTNLSEMPLVASVNPNYKATLELKSLEIQYIQASKDYLAEFKAVTAYNEKSASILELAEDFDKIGEKFETAESEADVMAIIDQYISKLNQVNKIATAMKPAESVKEMHQLNLQSLQQLTQLMKDLKAALQALDLEKLMTLSESADKINTDFEKQSKKLAIKLVEESKLAKLGNKLNDLGKKIDTKTAEL
ncbi:MAG TPA: hypothetical protein VFS14_00795 [Candidatus Saccharimonadales bacterium]|nr:hypothetical protein [Candidatus Saccharimonadales bacterium]